MDKDSSKKERSKSIGYNKGEQALRFGLGVGGVVGTALTNPIKKDTLPWSIPDSELSYSNSDEEIKITVGSNDVTPKDHLSAVKKTIETEVVSKKDAAITQTSGHLRASKDLLNLNFENYLLNAEHTEELIDHITKLKNKSLVSNIIVGNKDYLSFIQTTKSPDQECAKNKADYFHGFLSRSPQIKINYKELFTILRAKNNAETSANYINAILEYLEANYLNVTYKVHQKSRKYNYKGTGDDKIEYQKYGEVSKKYPYQITVGGFTLSDKQEKFQRISAEINSLDQFRNDVDEITSYNRSDGTATIKAPKKRWRDEAKKHAAIFKKEDIQDRGKYKFAGSKEYTHFAIVQKLQEILTQHFSTYQELDVNSQMFQQFNLNYQNIIRIVAAIRDYSFDLVDKLGNKQALVNKYKLQSITNHNNTLYNQLHFTHNDFKENNAAAPQKIINLNDITSENSLEKIDYIRVTICKEDKLYAIKEDDRDDNDRLKEERLQELKTLEQEKTYIAIEEFLNKTTHRIEKKEEIKEKYVSLKHNNDTFLYKVTKKGEKATSSEILQDLYSIHSPQESINQFIALKYPELHDENKISEILKIINSTAIKSLDIGQDRLEVRIHAQEFFHILNLLIGISEEISIPKTKSYFTLRLEWPHLLGQKNIAQEVSDIIGIANNNDLLTNINLHHNNFAAETLSDILITLAQCRALTNLNILEGKNRYSTNDKIKHLQAIRGLLYGNFNISDITLNTENNLDISRVTKKPETSKSIKIEEIISPEIETIFSDNSSPLSVKFLNDQGVTEFYKIFKEDLKSSFENIYYENFKNVTLTYLERSKRLFDIVANGQSSLDFKYAFKDFKESRKIISPNQKIIDRLPISLYFFLAAKAMNNSLMFNSLEKFKSHFKAPSPRIKQSHKISEERKDFADFSIVKDDNTEIFGIRIHQIKTLLKELNEQQDNIKYDDNFKNEVNEIYLVAIKKKAIAEKQKSPITTHYNTTERLRILKLVFKANYIDKGYFPHNGQILALLTLLDVAPEKRGNLGQIFTGEGKTAITIEYVATVCLMDPEARIDVVSSNSSLAKRDWQENEDFYSILKINSAFNGLGNKREIYNGKYVKNQDGENIKIENRVIYGEFGEFVADWLEKEFINKTIREAKPEEVDLFIDECDTQLLDNVTTIMRYSNQVADLKYLDKIYSRIWNLCTKYKPLELKTEILKKKNTIPAYLNKFVEANIDLWIEMANTARLYERDREYIISTDQNGNQKVEIMDIDTGEIQKSMEWSDGLHKFINIKEGITPDQESLSAIFGSYSKYLNKYKTISGVTGTLGIKEKTEKRGNQSKISFDTENDATAQFFKRRYEVNLFRIDRYKKNSDPNNRKETIVNYPAEYSAHISSFPQAELIQESQIKAPALEEKLFELFELEKNNQLPEIESSTDDSQLFTSFADEEADSTNQVIEQAIRYLAKTNQKQLQFKIDLLLAIKNDIFYCQGLNKEEKRKLPTLIICKTIKHAKELNCLLKVYFKYIAPEEEKKISFNYSLVDGEDNLKKMLTHTKNGIDYNEIIIATNLAGRGTDIKVSNKINKAGGLQVIVSFVADNSRIKDQAYGRTNRKGAEGRAITIAYDPEPPQDPNLQSYKNLEAKAADKEAAKIANIESKIISMKIRDDLMSRYFEEIEEIYQKRRIFQDAISYEDNIYIEQLRYHWALFLKSLPADEEQDQDKLKETLDNKFEEFKDRLLAKESFYIRKKFNNIVDLSALARRYLRDIQLSIGYTESALKIDELFIRDKSNKAEFILDPKYLSEDNELLTKKLKNYIKVTNRSVPKESFFKIDKTLESDELKLILEDLFQIWKHNYTFTCDIDHFPKDNLLTFLSKKQKENYKFFQIILLVEGRKKSFDLDLALYAKSQEIEAEINDLRQIHHLDLRNRITINIPKAQISFFDYNKQFKFAVSYNKDRDFIEEGNSKAFAYQFKPLILDLQTSLKQKLKIEDKEAAIKTQLQDINLHILGGYCTIFPSKIFQLSAYYIDKRTFPHNLVIWKNNGPPDEHCLIFYDKNNNVAFTLFYNIEKTQNLKGDALYKQQLKIGQTPPIGEDESLKEKINKICGKIKKELTGKDIKSGIETLTSIKDISRLTAEKVSILNSKDYELYQSSPRELFHRNILQNPQTAMFDYYYYAKELVDTGNIQEALIFYKQFRKQLASFKKYIISELGFNNRDDRIFQENDASSNKYINNLNNHLLIIQRLEDDLANFLGVGNKRISLNNTIDLPQSKDQYHSKYQQLELDSKDKMRQTLLNAKILKPLRLSKKVKAIFEIDNIQEEEILSEEYRLYKLSDQYYDKAVAKDEWENTIKITDLFLDHNKNLLKTNWLALLDGCKFLSFTLLKSEKIYKLTNISLQILQEINTLNSLQEDQKTDAQLDALINQYSAHLIDKKTWEDRMTIHITDLFAEEDDTLEIELRNNCSELLKEKQYINFSLLGSEVKYRTTEAISEQELQDLYDLNFFNPDQKIVKSAYTDKESIEIETKSKLVEQELTELLQDEFDNIDKIYDFQDYKTELHTNNSLEIELLFSFSILQENWQDLLANYKFLKLSVSNIDKILCLKNLDLDEETIKHLYDIHCHDLKYNDKADEKRPNINEKSNKSSLTIKDNILKFLLNSKTKSLSLDGKKLENQFLFEKNINNFLNKHDNSEIQTHRNNHYRQSFRQITNQYQFRNKIYVEKESKVMKIGQIIFDQKDLALFNEKEIFEIEENAIILSLSTTKRLENLSQTTDTPFHDVRTHKDFLTDILEIVEDIDNTLTERLHSQADNQDPTEASRIKKLINKNIKLKIEINNFKKELVETLATKPQSNQTWLDIIDAQAQETQNLLEGKFQTYDDDGILQNLIQEYNKDPDQQNSSWFSQKLSNGISTAKSALGLGKTNGSDDSQIKQSFLLFIKELQEVIEEKQREEEENEEDLLSAQDKEIYKLTIDYLQNAELTRHYNSHISQFLDEIEAAAAVEENNYPVQTTITPKLRIPLPKDYLPVIDTDELATKYLAEAIEKNSNVLQALKSSAEKTQKFLKKHHGEYLTLGQINNEIGNSILVNLLIENGYFTDKKSCIIIKEAELHLGAIDHDLADNIAAVIFCAQFQQNSKNNFATPYQSRKIRITEFLFDFHPEIRENIIIALLAQNILKQETPNKKLLNQNKNKIFLEQEFAGSLNAQGSVFNDSYEYVLTILKQLEYNEQEQNEYKGLYENKSPLSLKKQGIAFLLYEIFNNHDLDRAITYQDIEKYIDQMYQHLGLLKYKNKVAIEYQPFGSQDTAAKNYFRENIQSQQEKSRSQKEKSPSQKQDNKVSNHLDNFKIIDNYIAQIPQITAGLNSRKEIFRKLLLVISHDKDFVENSGNIRLYTKYIKDKILYHLGEENSAKTILAALPQKYTEKVKSVNRETSKETEEEQEQEKEKEKEQDEEKNNSKTIYEYSLILQIPRIKGTFTFKSILDNDKTSYFDKGDKLKNNSPIKLPGSADSPYDNEKERFQLLLEDIERNHLSAIYEIKIEHSLTKINFSFRELYQLLTGHATNNENEEEKIVNYVASSKNIDSLFSANGPGRFTVKTKDRYAYHARSTTMVDQKMHGLDLIEKEIKDLIDFVQNNLLTATQNPLQQANIKNDFMKIFDDFINIKGSYKILYSEEKKERISKEKLKEADILIYKNKDSSAYELFFKEQNNNHFISIKEEQIRRLGHHYIIDLLLELNLEECKEQSILYEFEQLKDSFKIKFQEQQGDNLEINIDKFEPINDLDDIFKSLQLNVKTHHVFIPFSKIVGDNRDTEYAVDFVDISEFNLRSKKKQKNDKDDVSKLQELTKLVTEYKNYWAIKLLHLDLWQASGKVKNSIDTEKTSPKIKEYFTGIMRSNSYEDAPYSVVNSIHQYINSLLVHYNKNIVAEHLYLLVKQEGLPLYEDTDLYNEIDEVNSLISHANSNLDNLSDIHTIISNEFNEDDLNDIESITSLEENTRDISDIETIVSDDAGKTARNIDDVQSIISQEGPAENISDIETIASNNNETKFRNFDDIQSIISQEGPAENISDIETVISNNNEAELRDIDDIQSIISQKEHTKGISDIETIASNKDIIDLREFDELSSQISLHENRQDLSEIETLSSDPENTGLISLTDITSQISQNESKADFSEVETISSEEASTVLRNFDELRSQNSNNEENKDVSTIESLNSVHSEHKDCSDIDSSSEIISLDDSLNNPKASDETREQNSDNNENNNTLEDDISEIAVIESLAFRRRGPCCPGPKLCNII